MAGPAAVLNRERHVRYWLRCLKTVLPTEYTSNDANRATLAFFTVCALDLLDALHSHTSAPERADYVAWVYRLQHPSGGFRGFPGTDLGAARGPHNARWDPASLPATYFALATLLILGDDLERVEREQCLAWVASLQRPDGSFGDVLDANTGAPSGGRDTRFCYSAAAVRYMLRRQGRGSGPDIDVDSLVRYLNSCEVSRRLGPSAGLRCVKSLEHGIAEAPHKEAHGACRLEAREKLTGTAGHTYCAVAALSLLGRLPDQAAPASVVGLPNVEQTLYWLVSRQVPHHSEDSDDDGSEMDAHATHSAHAAPQATSHDAFSIDDSLPSPLAPHYAGFNGRTGKEPDTCYSFWVGGSLAVRLPGPFSTAWPMSRVCLLSAHS